MVGGTDFEQDGRSTWPPTATASRARRSSRSSCSRALQNGVSPEATFTSQRKKIPVRGGEQFVVNNYEDSVRGHRARCARPPRTSDNSVYAELGLKVGTKRDRRAWRGGWACARRLSTNPAMTLGGLEEGVTPLEMAYAYSTIANSGVRVSGIARRPSTAARWRSRRSTAAGVDDDERAPQRAGLPRGRRRDRAAAAGRRGLGRHRQARPQIGEFAAGKTGTTENYGDAWFVGFNEELTVAVWVGYPDKLQLHEDRVPRRRRWPAAPSRPRSGTTS